MHLTNHPTILDTGRPAKIGAGAPDELKLTCEMIGIGVATYFAWDSENEEIESLVSLVYQIMRDASLRELGLK